MEKRIHAFVAEIQNEKRVRTGFVEQSEAMPTPEVRSATVAFEDV